ncbi:MAG: hypothetical protein IT228_07685 [Flavobacteriales bacterium]|nr:hypothetical protein [Flavobacteriales bacterium]MCC6577206.1 hypothetical protein [Flavobacteriales bacterium]
MRRVAILLVLTGLTGLGAWWVLRDLGPTTPTADPWQLLPEDTRAVLALPDAAVAWERWSHGCALGVLLKDLPSLHHIARVADALAPLRDRLAGIPVLAAWGDATRTAGGPLLIVSPPADALDALLPLLGAAPATDAPQALRVDGLPDGWYVLAHHGLLLLATDADRLRAVTGAARTTPVPDAPWHAARSTLGGHATAHLLLRTGTPPAGTVAPWNALFAALPDTDGWLALDLEPRADGLIAGGVLMPFAQEPPPAQADPLPALRVLPGTVRWYEQRSLPADSTATGWHDDDLVRARAPGSKGPLQWTVLHTADPLAAASTVGGSAAADAPHRAYRGKLMMQVDGLRDLAALPGDSAPWCVLHEDWCILAFDSTAARLAVDALLDGNTLGQDLALATELTHLAAPAQRTWWCDIAAGGPALHHRTADAPPPAPWNALGTLLVQQVRTDGGKAYVSIALRPARTDGPVPEAPRVDSLPVTTAATGIARLQAVRNHVNGSQELLVQDSAGVLSLRTAGGLVLWQVPLDGPLLGPALQVDRYRNGKLQLLALTARTLYLIDRNGRAVEGFPVTLPAPASAPVACFDYDRDGQLRLLVPLSDGRVLNLAADGRPVPGWEPPQAKAAIASAVHHLRLRGKDHLLYADADGTLHHVDRRGTRRSTPKLELPAGAQLVAVLSGPADAVVPVWRTADGVLAQAPLAGRTVRLGMGVLAAGTIGDVRGHLLWWATADSLFVRGADGKTHAMAAAEAVQDALLVRLHDRDWWALRGTQGRWRLADGRGRTVAEATDDGPAVLTDLEPDGRPELLVLPRQGGPEVRRPGTP